MKKRKFGRNPKTCLGPLASKPLCQLGHVDCLDQIQAHSAHVLTCCTQCLLTMLIHLSSPHDGISGPL
jgi:hypothetical protein